MKKLCALMVCLIAVMFFAIPGYAEIGKGAKGDDVVALQERLIELGFLDDVADGIFGGKTKAALEAFQAANSLKVTGVATIKDVQIIFSEGAIGVANEPPLAEIAAGDNDAENVAPATEGLDVAAIDESGILLAPAESFIVERLTNAPNVAVVAAATANNDPNGNLGKQGGYTSHIYFSSPLVSGSYAKNKTSAEVIAAGTDCGGSIEVYSSIADAKSRDAYLGAFDGTMISSGSHTLVGSVIIRISSQLSASEQQSFTSEILSALSNEETPCAEALGSESNGALIPDEDMPMLTVKDSGFVMSNGYFQYAVILHNNSNTRAVEFPSFRVIIRDKDGGLLGVAQQTLNVTYPGQDAVWGGFGSEVDGEPASMEVEIIDPEDYNIVNPLMFEHAEYVPLEVRGAKIKNGGTLIGEVYNPNGYDVYSCAISVLFRDGEGKLLAGDTGYCESVKAGKSTAFEIYVSSNIITDSYEAYAMPW